MSRLLPALLSLAAAFGPSAVLAAGHRTGLLCENLALTAPTHRATSVGPWPDASGLHTPVAVDLSSEVPPVGNQGTQGSCCSWAIGYYHRSQLEYRERGWDLADPNHQFSPAFLYNQVNGGLDQGSYFSENMQLVCEQGCASLAESPYRQSDYSSWPSESAYSHAIPYRCRDWFWFETPDTAGLTMMKRLLAGGSTCVLGIWCWGNFDNIGRYDNVYCVADRTGTNAGGHAVCVVGYDDTLTTSDGSGAFRLVNSWGPGWGDSGFCWISYQAVMDTLLSQRAVDCLVDTVGYEPRLLARVRLDHPTRDRVDLNFIVGSAAGPFWYRKFRSWRRCVADQPFPAHNLVFDLTDGAAVTSSRTMDSVYVCCRDSHSDGLAGNIASMSVQYLPFGNVFYADSAPVAIPDDGTTVFAGTTAERYDVDACAGSVLAPSGVVEPESSYVPAVEVRNYGTGPASFLLRLSIGSDYADSASVSNLAPAGVRQLSFRTWTCPDTGSYAVRCTTALDGDEYAANDTCSALLSVRYHDIELIEILTPGDTVDSGVATRPTVRVRNNGTQTETFVVVFLIPADAYSHAVQLTVTGGAEDTVQFVPWTPQALGVHALSCTLRFTPDQNLTNNRLDGSVYVRSASGVAEKPAGGSHQLTICPNPFDGHVTIRWDPGPSDQSAGTTVTLYNACGCRVRALQVLEGTEMVWDGCDESGRHVPPGSYFCRVRTGTTAVTVPLLRR